MRIIIFFQAFLSFWLSAAKAQSQAHSCRIGSISNLRAEAELLPVGGSGVKGKIVFVQACRGYTAVEIKIRVNGLTGQHGFHIHNGNDCADLQGHFDVTGYNNHGGPSSPERHTGDLGNVQDATSVIFADELSLDSENAANIVGRTIAITKNADDFGVAGRSREDGNSGPILTCGKITAKSLENTTLRANVALEPNSGSNVKGEFIALQDYPNRQLTFRGRVDGLDVVHRAFIGSRCLITSLKGNTVKIYQQQKSANVKNAQVEFGLFSLLDRDPHSAIGQFLVIINEKAEIVACGVVKKENERAELTTEVDLHDISGSQQGGKLVFHQAYPSSTVSVKGTVAGVAESSTSEVRWYVFDGSDCQNFGKPFEPVPLNGRLPVGDLGLHQLPLALSNKRISLRENDINNVIGRPLVVFAGDTGTFCGIIKCLPS